MIQRLPSEDAPPTVISIETVKLASSQVLGACELHRFNRNYPHSTLKNWQVWRHSVINRLKRVAELGKLSFSIGIYIKHMIRLTSVIYRLPSIIYVSAKCCSSGRTKVCNSVVVPFLFRLQAVSVFCKFDRPRKLQFGWVKVIFWRKETVCI